MPNHYELQWKLIYAMIVANKSAKFANAKVDKMQGLIGWTMPFEAIAEMDDAGLEALLRKVGTASYGRLTRGLRELVNAKIDLATCKPEELEAVYGIGCATARRFMLETRPGARHALIDNRILRWLEAQGHRRIPVGSEPRSAREYDRVEKIFLAEADKRGIAPQELNSQVWEMTTTKTVRSRRVCTVGGSDCLAPAGGRGSARATCFACGEPVCANCSARVHWLGQGKHRICANCLEKRRR